MKTAVILQAAKRGIPRRGNKLCAALIAVVFILLSLPFSPAVHGAAIPDFSDVDPDRQGSIRVSLQDVDGNLVSGGTLTVYAAARITRGTPNALTLTEAFSGWEKGVMSLYEDQDSAEDLAAYAAGHGVQPTQTVQNETGSLTFPELAPGVYLLAQGENAPNYESMTPFLVYVPQAENGSIVYDVTAEPKPITPLPPAELRITAEKLVEVRNGSASSETPFSFILTPESPEAPMPRNTEAIYNKANGSMTMTRRGPGEVDFGLLPLDFSDDGAVYVYTLREIKGTALYYDYDVSVFTYTVKVTMNRGTKTLEVDCTVADENGKSVDRATFTNIYDNPETPIPRTGQLWWPVGVMLASGVSLLVFGFERRRRDKEDSL